MDSVVEEPYKIPYLAALFTLLLQTEPEEETDGSLQDSVQAVFDEFCKSFQASLDTLAWRDIRLTVRYWLECYIISTSYRYLTSRYTSSPTSHFQKPSLFPPSWICCKVS